jgi:hypothetical protein
VGIAQLCALCEADIAKVDVAAMNLVCAGGLAGGPAQEIEHYLDWLDEAARTVKLETERNYFQFLENPQAFEFSQARFCAVSLVTILQRRCGVQYNPKWRTITPDASIPDQFGLDASDVFVHAIIDGIGGTCGSLPAIYVAIGRRLGYPLKLVKAARHLYVRWDDPHGRLWFHPDRFNVEATGPGVHFLPDEHYRHWPHPLLDEDVESGIFLKSLTPQEELAEFLATRGYCLFANGRVHEAMDAFSQASQLAPHNRHFAASYRALRLHLTMHQRSHSFLNAPRIGFRQQPHGPFWMDGHGGHKILVQIVSPVRQPFEFPRNLGLHLVRQALATPNGLHVDVWLPTYAPGSQMTAHWVRLTDGRWALVHKPETDSWHRLRHAQDNSPAGHPIVPHAEHRIPPSWPVFGTTNSPAPTPSKGMSHQEQLILARQIEHTIRHMCEVSDSSKSLSMPHFVLPAGPTEPLLPSIGIGKQLD